jgi:hypothetical protein
MSWVTGGAVTTSTTSAKPSRGIVGATAGAGELTTSDYRRSLRRGVIVGRSELSEGENIAAQP